MKIIQIKIDLPRLARLFITSLPNIGIFATTTSTKNILEITFRHTSYLNKYSSDPDSHFSSDPDSHLFYADPDSSFFLYALQNLKQIVMS